MVESACVIDSLVIWFVRSITPVDRLCFVRNHLRRGVRYDSGFRWIRVDEDEDMVDQADEGHRRRFSVDDRQAAKRSGAVREDAMVRDFVENFLHADGVFLLRLIAHNTSGITATEVTKEMWDLWYDRRHGQNAVEPFDDSTEIKRRID